MSLMCLCAVGGQMKASWESTIYGKDSLQDSFPGICAIAPRPVVLLLIQHYNSCMQCKWLPDCVPILHCLQLSVQIIISKSTPNPVQGCTKRLFPGLEKLGEKVAFFLPTAGRRTQFFHLIFTQPGKGLLVQPCKWKAPLKMKFFLFQSSAE